MMVNEARSGVKEIDLEQARERLAQNPKAVLLDVREDLEWQNGHAVEAKHLGKGIFRAGHREDVSGSRILSSSLLTWRRASGPR